MKTWGGQPFWGLGDERDPDWLLTPRQRELRGTLIDLCEREIRDNAERSDDELRFPRRSLELLGEHGFLALTVPEEYGGLGGDHTTFAMACETIARYGCAWMLHACGGSGYRHDLELERYLRDGKAGWVMGPSHEVLRQFVGRSALFGLSAVDYWNRTVDERALRNETGKLDSAAKRALAARLLAEADEAERKITAGR